MKSPEDSFLYRLFLRNKFKPMDKFGWLLMAALILISFFIGAKDDVQRIMRAKNKSSPGKNVYSKNIRPN